MKKYKKILAVLLTLVMVLGMSITSAAAEISVDGDGADGAAGGQQESATVTITSITSNTNLSYVQIVEPDQTTKTGWKFCDDTIAGIFKDAFKLESDKENEPDAQTAMERLIEAQKTDAKRTEENVISAANTSSKLANALDAVKNNSDIVKTALYAVSSGITSTDFTVNKAGIYAIQGSEPGYTYNNMAAFVAFGEVTGKDGTVTKAYPALQDVTISAKKTPDSIEKEVDDTDKVVPVGSIVTYTITTTVPNVASNENNKTFTVTDKLYGADYYLDDEDGKKTDAYTGQQVVAEKSVKMGEAELDVGQYTWSEVTSDTDNDGTYKTFTVTLDSLIDEANTNAGKKITITYTAVVTSPDGTSNGASKHFSGVKEEEKPETPDVKTYSGQITLTKYAEDNNNDNLEDNTKLAGAKFKVYMSKDKDETAFEAVKWAKFDPNGVFTGWDADEANATEVTTGEEGTLVVKGLELGTYGFKETEAPKGYHINMEDETATLALGSGEATATIVSSAAVIDSKLSALPSTGGIGTTIFTIGGCAIMIAAAFLFFASRKKKEEK